MILSINETNPQPRNIQRVAAFLKEGGLIAYPTDTHYGIGCDITNKKAIERVHLLMQRDKSKPFSFICSDLKHISDYAKVSNYGYRMLKKLLPGPYTFILDGSKMVPKLMLTKRKTAGIRVPDNPICHAIVEELGNPILTATASLPGEDPLNNAWSIEDTFGHALDVVIDGGDVPEIPSSIVSLIDDEPEVIREGAGDISMFL